MRRLLVHLATLTLAVVGSQVAHSAVYRIVAPNADERAHLLAESGHAYLRLEPLGLALATVVVLVALFSEGRALGDPGTRPRLWLFAVVAPATFACQEVFERLLHDGAMPWGAPLERTFLLGLALQLPFAVAAYLLARALLGAARLVGRVLAPPRLTVLHAAGSLPVVAVHGIPRAAETRSGGGSRAPPLLLL